MTVMMSLRFHANDLIRLTEKVSMDFCETECTLNAFENSVEKKWQEQLLDWWNMWIKQPLKISFFSIILSRQRLEEGR